MKQKIELAQSVNTSSVNQDIKQPAAPAEHIKNNGIHADGGITNLYIENDIYASGEHFTADNGLDIEAVQNGDNIDIVIDGKNLGTLPAEGIEYRTLLKGHNDVGFDGVNLVTVDLIGSTLYRKKYTLDGEFVPGSTTTSAVGNIDNLGPVQSVNWVRNSARDLDQVVIRSGTKAVIWTIGTSENIINDFDSPYQFYSAAYDPGRNVTAFIDQYGRVSSVDQFGKWKYFDGTGDGAGPYSGRRVADSIVSSCIYSELINGFVFAISAGTVSASIVFSWNSTGWKYHDGEGSGNGIFGTINSVTSPALQEFEYTYDGGPNKAIFLGGLSGRVVSWDYEQNFKNYDGTGPGKAFYTNGGMVSTETILFVSAGADYCVFASALYISSIDSAGNTRSYLGAGTGTGPYGTNSVVNSESIKRARVVNGILFILSAQKVANYQAGAWTNYDGTGAGVGPFASSKAGGNDVMMTTADNAQYVFAFNTGTASVSFSSFTGSWSYYDGTGTPGGFFSDGKNSPAGGLNALQFVELPTSPGVDYTYKNYGLLCANGGVIHLLTEQDNALYFYPDQSNIAAYPDKFFSVAASVIKSVLYKYGDKDYLVHMSTSLISSYCIQTGLWKYDDGTGLGDGPYGTAASLTGGGTFLDLVQYDNFLVIATTAGRVASFEGNLPRSYLGVGAGSGPFDNNTAIATTVNKIFVYNDRFLIIAGNSGRLGSWDGIAWKTYLGVGTGTGPFNNNTAVTGNIVGAGQYNDFLVIGSSTGLIGSYDGANWKNYNGTGTGTGPYDGTALILGAVPVGIIRQYKNQLVVCRTGSANIRIGSWDGVAWKYNSGTGTGTGIYLNYSGTTENPIDALEFQDNFLILSDIKKGIISWNGEEWITDESLKGYYTGTPFKSFVVIAGNLYLMGYGQANIVQDNKIQPVKTNALFTTDTGIVKTVTLPDNSRGDMFAYKSLDFVRDVYSGYILNIDGNAIEQGLFVYDFDGILIKAKNIINKSAPPYNVDPVEILISTNTPFTIDNDIFALGVFGDISDGYFSGVPAYPEGLKSAALLQKESGPGYAGVSFTAQDGATYTAILPAENGLYREDWATDSDILPGNRGRLSSGVTGGTVDRGFFSVPINGFFGIISFATNDGNVGLSLTSLGDSLLTYAPNANADESVVYKNSQGHVFIKIGTPLERFQKITPTLYKVNTISIFNLIDIEQLKLFVGSLDYSGRFVINNTGASSAILKRVVGLFSGQYSNSIDTGEKLAGVDVLTAGLIVPLAAKTESPGINAEAYAVDFYLDDDYLASFDETGAVEIVTEKSGTQYIEDPREPMAAWSIYNDGVAYSAGKTFYLFGDDYDGAQGGNSIVGVFGYFNLFGQDYIFDDKYIYLITIDENGFVSQQTKTAPKTGLEFLAISPVAAVFYSNFNNSIYTFDGGRSLTKTDILNRQNSVINGVFSVYENALYVQTSDTFIVYREGLKTVISKTAGMTGLKLYNTDSGVFFGNNTNRWRYTYKDNGGAVVPLDFQTAFFGEVGVIIKSGVFMAQIFSPERVPIVLTLLCYSFNETGATTQTRKINIGANDWDANNMAFVRIQPENLRGAGVSFGLRSDFKVILTDIYMEYIAGDSLTTLGSV